MRGFVMFVTPVCVLFLRNWSFVRKQIVLCDSSCEDFEFQENKLQGRLP